MLPSTGSGFLSSLGSCTGNSTSVGTTALVFSLWLRLGEADLTDLGETGLSSIGVVGLLLLDGGGSAGSSPWKF